MCEEEACGEPRMRPSLARGKGGQDGVGGHQQNFVKKTRTRMRCAGVKDKWK